MDRVDERNSGGVSLGGDAAEAAGEQRGAQQRERADLRAERREAAREGAARRLRLLARLDPLGGRPVQQPVRRKGEDALGAKGDQLVAPSVRGDGGGASSSGASGQWQDEGGEW